MVAEGDLKGQLDLKPIDDNIIDGQDEEAALNERLKALTSQSKCMLFMKGSPDNESGAAFRGPSWLYSGSIPSPSTPSTF